MAFLTRICEGITTGSYSYILDTSWKAVLYLGWTFLLLGTDACNVLISLTGQCVLLSCLVCVCSLRLSWVSLTSLPSPW